MGLLSTALLAPVKLVTWTADQVLAAAEAELYDPGRIREALVRLNEDHDRGLVSEEEFLAAEDALMERLEIASDREARR